MEQSKSKKITLIISIALYILTALFIIVQSLFNAENSTAESLNIVKIISSLPIIKNQNYTELEYLAITRKLVGHYMLHGFLGIFSFIIAILTVNKRRTALLYSAASGIFWAVASELLQFIPEGRAPSFNDILLDFQGYLTIHLFMSALFVIIEYNKQPLNISQFTDFMLFFSISLIVFSLNKILNTGNEYAICLIITIAVSIISFIVYYLVKIIEFKTQSKSINKPKDNLDADKKESTINDKEHSDN